VGGRNPLSVHQQNTWLSGRAGSSRRDLTSPHSGTGKDYRSIGIGQGSFSLTAS
jgi:hypothetical protein